MRYVPQPFAAVAACAPRPRPYRARPGTSSDEGLQQRVQPVVGECAHLDKGWRAIGAAQALSPALSSRRRVTTRCTTCSTGVTSSDCAARGRRRGMGSDSTHCRTGTYGMTWSTRYAAVCDIRRAPHDGQNPRRLQLKASSLSWPHSPQRSLRNPCAGMPHSRKASTSSLMKRCGRRSWPRAAEPYGPAWSAPGGDARSGPGRHRAPAGLPADGLHARLPKW
jgi:hypothetical protein